MVNFSSACGSPCAKSGVAKDVNHENGHDVHLSRGAPNVVATEQGARWAAGLAKGGEASAETALDLIGTFAQGEMDPELLADYSPGSPIYGSVWEEMVKEIEAYNDPGTFTTFHGFEWTSLIEGNNMHRNVIFRDDPQRVLRIQPMTTQPPIGSPDPMDLYDWLQAYEDKTGGQVFALAHNGNLSNGIMFPLTERYDGSPVDDAYALARAKWEPLYEITQIKGDGEAHPALSPGDAFADYETWDVGNLDLSAAKTPEMLAGEYAREALKRVIEIPTPRWVLYDKVRLGADLPEEAVLVGQERGYTSPIWYMPE